MTRKIAVFTGTRAEYSLLYRLMKGLAEDPDFILKLIVGGAHFAPQFGETWREIVSDGFDIDARVDISVDDDTPIGVAQSMGRQLSGTARALADVQPDILVVLGDRTEALAAASAALVMCIPVAHIHGGEITEGAYDDQIRHAITKLSHLHFVAAEPYRTRIMQMGEAPGAVHTVGALGIDNLTLGRRMDRDTLSEELQFDLTHPYVLATYHPETLGNAPPEAGFRVMMDALKIAAPDHRIVVTYPSADVGGLEIIRAIETASKARPDNIIAVRSLGRRYFPSVLAHADLIIGNSSSGVIEAPVVGTPTVDIGARQAGRLRASSIFHAETELPAISAAVRRALGGDWNRDSPLPYGHGRATAAILDELRNLPDSLVKTFHDWTDR